MDRSLLEKKQLAELREIASTLDLRGYQRMKKADLVDLIVGAGGDDANGDGGATSDDGGRRERSRDAQSDDADGQGDGDEGGDGDGGRNRNKQRRRKNRGGNQQDLEDAEVREGVLDLLPEGYGFLRTTGYLSGARDVYVSQSYVRRFNLRRGDRVRGPIRSNNRGNDKFPALARVDAVEGMEVDDHLEQERPEFDHLTPLFPDQRLPLAGGADAPPAMRMVDLFAPVGRGQRGLLVAPPRAGTTTVLREMAQAIESSGEDVDVLVVLVDERPEEITEFERAIDGEVVSSTFDRPAEDHTAVAELALERAKRLVERGRDVVVLLDSITRLTRAYNLASSGSGRTLPGGLDAGALAPAKRFLGAARNVEDGGSLTIVAAALVDTGSDLDAAIFEEFRSTGTMELWLDRRMQQQRVFPAIDVPRSGTRREELLLEDDTLETVREIRRAVGEVDPLVATEALVARMADTKDNAAFLDEVDPAALV